MELNDLITIFNQSNDPTTRYFIRTVDGEGITCKYVDHLQSSIEVTTGTPAATKFIAVAHIVSIKAV